MSEPNGQHDAHVQILTAEVRTLMVGSRQVTLSVYGQLDHVPVNRIEPFGRVAPRDGDYWKTYVVGRDRSTGALVRSSVFSGTGAAELIERGTVQAGAHRVRPSGWPYSNAEDQQVLAELAKEWDALPLIVLAGLR